jgi:hypothetical protein
MKTKRIIDVGGHRYIWVLDGNEVYSEGRFIRVTREGAASSRLYINPYHHDLEIRPATIRAAINAAREMGWKPEENSGDFRLKFDDGRFVEDITA